MFKQWQKGGEEVTFPLVYNFVEENKEMLYPRSPPSSEHQDANSQPDSNNMNLNTIGNGKLNTNEINGDLVKNNKSSVIVRRSLKNRCHESILTDSESDGGEPAQRIQRTSIASDRIDDELSVVGVDESDGATVGNRNKTVDCLKVNESVDPNVGDNKHLAMDNSVKRTTNDNCIGISAINSQCIVEAVVHQSNRDSVIDIDISKVPDNKCSIDDDRKRKLNESSDNVTNVLIDNENNETKLCVEIKVTEDKSANTNDNKKLIEIQNVMFTPPFMKKEYPSRIEFASSDSESDHDMDEDPCYAEVVLREKVMN